jgi:CheY-like chemotaxis protein
VLNAAEAIGEQAGLITLRTGSIQADEQLLAQARSDHPLTPGPYVYLKVEDTGGGMDAEALERIFDPFFTTKFIGRGLGLSAVMGIVRGHHGGIIVTSQMGEGTCFQVLLPIESSPPSDPPTRDDQSASSPDGLLDGQGQTILVIDDEQAVLTVASQMLQRLGFQTLLAQNGQQAIQAVQSTPDIRAVLLDLSMPVMSGEKIFTEIQTIQPDMHIFLCSGYSEEETMDRFSKKGICGFLQKPFQLKTLAEKLKPIIQSP